MGRNKKRYTIQYARNVLYEKIVKEIQEEVNRGDPEDAKKRKRGGDREKTAIMALESLVRKGKILKFMYFGMGCKQPTKMDLTHGTDFIVQYVNPKSGTYKLSRLAVGCYGWESANVPTASFNPEAYLPVIEIVILNALGLNGNAVQKI